MYDSQDTQMPYIGMISNGTTSLIYFQNLPNTELFYAVYSQHGAVIKLPTSIPLSSEIYRVSTNGDTYLLTWIEDTDTDQLLKGLLISSDGLDVAEPFVVGTSCETTDPESWTVTSCDNKYYVAWAGKGLLDNDGIYGSIITAEGSIEYGPFLINTNTEDIQQKPAIASNGTTLYAAWQNEPDNGAKRVIYGQLMNPQGNPIGSVQQISDSGQTHQSPVIHSNGNSYLVVYADYYSTSFNARLLDNDGIPQGYEHTFTVNATAFDEDTIWLNENLDSDMSSVKIETLNDDYYVFWEQLRQGPIKCIFSQKITESNTTTHAEYITHYMDDGNYDTASNKTNIVVGSCGYYGTGYTIAHGVHAGDARLINEPESYHIETVCTDNQNIAFAQTWRGSGNSVQIYYTIFALDSLDDLDGDGVTNEMEASYGSDPNSIDSDNDGLTDYEEIKLYYTSPTDDDMDGDGISDYDEIKIYHTNPYGDLPDTYMVSSQSHYEHGNGNMIAYNGKIYWGGGYVWSSSTYLSGADKLECYDPVTDTWTDLADLPDLRCLMGGFVLDDQIYFIGGEKIYLYKKDTVWKYDPAQDEWETMSSFPEIICQSSKAIVNGVAYVTGGHNYQGNVTNTYRYEVENDSWILEYAPEDREKHQLCVTESYNGKIYYFGSWHNSTTDVTIYDPVTKEITQGASMPPEVFPDETKSYILRSVVYKDYAFITATLGLTYLASNIFVYSFENDEWFIADISRFLPIADIHLPGGQTTDQINGILYFHKLDDQSHNLYGLNLNRILHEENCVLTKDTDKDGLPDYDELFKLFTNPKSADTDNDGISDGDEVLLYNTSPSHKYITHDIVIDGKPGWTAAIANDNRALIFTSNVYPDVYCEAYLIDQNGHTVSAPINLLQSGEVRELSVTYLNDIFYCAWSEDTSSLYVCPIDIQGNAGNVKLITSNNRINIPIIASNGEDLMLTWSTTYSGSGSIYGIQLDAETFEGTIIPIADNECVAGTHVLPGYTIFATSYGTTLLSDGSGYFALPWEELNPGGMSVAVNGQFFTIDGQTYGDTFSMFDYRVLDCVVGASNDEEYFVVNSAGMHGLHEGMFISPDGPHPNRSFVAKRTNGIGAFMITFGNDFLYGYNWGTENTLNAQWYLHPDGDHDCDGITNKEESVLFTNPLDNDSDNDGLGDFEEINTYTTNPVNPDSDNDSIPDGWEILHGFDPLTPDASDDPDCDGLTNADELKYKTNPDSNDSDNDRISDYDELFKLFTNPMSADSDNDGISDSKELSIIGGYRNISSSTSNVFPLIAKGDGVAMALWNSDNINLQARFLNANDSPISEEFTIASLSSALSKLKYALAYEDSTFFSVWVNDDNDIEGIMYDSSGDIIKNKFTVLSGDYIACNIASNGNGYAIMTVDNSLYVKVTYVNSDATVINNFTVYNTSNDILDIELVPTGSDFSFVITENGWPSCRLTVCTRSTEGNIIGSDRSYTFKRPEGFGVDTASDEFVSCITWIADDLADEQGSQMSGTLFSLILDSRTIDRPILRAFEQPDGMEYMFPSVIPYLDDHFLLTTIYRCYAVTSYLKNKLLLPPGQIELIKNAVKQAVCGQVINSHGEKRGNSFVLNRFEGNTPLIVDFIADDDSNLNVYHYGKNGTSSIYCIALDPGYNTDPTSPDTDGDGILDGFEVMYLLDPTQDDADKDYDNDGYANIVEYTYKTNPRDAESYPQNVEPDDFVAKVRSIAVDGNCGDIAFTFQFLEPAKNSGSITMDYRLKTPSDDSEDLPDWMPATISVETEPVREMDNCALIWHTGTDLSKYSAPVDKIRLNITNGRTWSYEFSSIEVYNQIYPVSLTHRAYLTEDDDIELTLIVKNKTDIDYTVRMNARLTSSTGQTKNLSDIRKDVTLERLKDTRIDISSGDNPGPGIYDLKLYLGDQGSEKQLAIIASPIQIIIDMLDYDDDGIPDNYEKIFVTDPDQDDSDSDADCDGLTLKEEFLLGTDPECSDTDHDGQDDSQEYSAGTDALNGDVYFYYTIDFDSSHNIVITWPCNPNCTYKLCVSYNDINNFEEIKTYKSNDFILYSYPHIEPSSGPRFYKVKARNDTINNDE